MRARVRRWSITYQPPPHRTPSRRAGHGSAPCSGRRRGPGALRPQALRLDMEDRRRSEWSTVSDTITLGHPGSVSLRPCTPSPRAVGAAAGDKSTANRTSQGGGSSSSSPRPMSSSSSAPARSTRKLCMVWKARCTSSEVTVMDVKAGASAGSRAARAESTASPARSHGCWRTSEMSGRSSGRLARSLFRRSSRRRSPRSAGNTTGSATMRSASSKGSSAAKGSWP
mmetsp:Transcript_23263/g.78164  ORF Transcript_23263/g.78164 Transcript_23263/m.78164 type:complete len:226 (+) Transcript_23263:778-1455(+)